MQLQNVILSCFYQYIPYHDIMRQAVGCRCTLHCRAVLPGFSSSLTWVLTLQEEDALHLPKSLHMIAISGWWGRALCLFWEASRESLLIRTQTDSFSPLVLFLFLSVLLLLVILYYLMFLLVNPFLLSQLDFFSPLPPSAFLPRRGERCCMVNHDTYVLFSQNVLSVLP